MSEKKKNTPAENAGSKMTKSAPQDSVDNRRAAKTPEAVDTAKTVETPETVETAKAVETPEAVDTAKAVETPEAVDTAKAVETPTADLGDISRVKVISPGRLVVKRFMRNRLAIVGACILIFMFLFALIGPVISPYKEDQTFIKYEGARTNYVSGTFDTTATFYGDTADRLSGTETAELSRLMDDTEVGQTVSREISGDSFTLTKTSVGTSDVSISRNTTDAVASVDVGGNVTFSGNYGQIDGLEGAIKAHLVEGAFDYDGVTYNVTKPTRFTYSVTTTKVTTFTGLLSKYFVYFNELLGSDNQEDIDPDFSLNDDGEKRAALIRSIKSGSFEHDGKTFAATVDDDGDVVFADGDKILAYVSTVRVVSASGTNDVFMSAVRDCVTALRHMREENLSEYTYRADAIVMNDSTNAFERTENAEIEVRLDHGVYSSTADMTRMLLDLNAAPSKEHWLGTDGNGMDNLTRMMYGGRVSLMVGFIVIVLEVLIGIVLGGIAGYFGGWVDMLIMRIVDVFNCVPFMPVMIILGAVFDSIMLNPWLRIVYIMMIMGLVSWTGVARLVRGQILSLREQEFMQAAEATGISVPRRIFKHLVPNVMPQLIVSATMGLGDVIIMESTLSFLGLGCKHPMSSWGTIINSVNTKFGLLNYTYVWIPVGLLISLTVIAFNFIGDGLRDAFDPKMKR